MCLFFSFSLKFILNMSINSKSLSLHFRCNSWMIVIVLPMTFYNNKVENEMFTRVRECIFPNIHLSGLIRQMPSWHLCIRKSLMFVRNECGNRKSAEGQRCLTGIGTVAWWDEMRCLLTARPMIPLLTYAISHNPSHIMYSLVHHCGMKDI